MDRVAARSVVQPHVVALTIVRDHGVQVSIPVQVTQRSMIADRTGKRIATVKEHGSATHDRRPEPPHKRNQGSTADHDLLCHRPLDQLAGQELIIRVECNLPLATRAADAEATICPTLEPTVHGQRRARYARPIHRGTHRDSQVAVHRRRVHISRRQHCEYVLPDLHGRPSSVVGAIPIRCRGSDLGGVGEHGAVRYAGACHPCNGDHAPRAWRQVHHIPREGKAPSGRDRCPTAGAAHSRDNERNPVADQHATGWRRTVVGILQRVGQVLAGQHRPWADPLFNRQVGRTQDAEQSVVAAVSADMCEHRSIHHLIGIGASVRNHKAELDRLAGGHRTRPRDHVP